jgi:predicted LPLAT superfamily acyltransferase
VSELKHDKWAGTTYGNGWMHKWLIKLLRVIDVRILYAFAAVFVVPPTMCINKNARRVMYRFYRDRLGYGAMRSAWMVYKNHCDFSQVVIDRFAMYAGKKFKIELDGYDQFLNLAAQLSGFIQLSSHIGNYEIAGYSLVAETKRFNALVFAGEKESVMANRSKMFDGNNIRMIPMMSDISHLFVINQALSDGEILSMPADRVFGSQKSFDIDFLGSVARFPQGPFIMAAVRDVPMLFVAVMKTASKTYHIIIRQIESAEQGTSKQKAESLAKQYVKLLETTVLRYPSQWYNYFDFWIK